MHLYNGPVSRQDQTSTATQSCSLEQGCVCEGAGESDRRQARGLGRTAGPSPSRQGAPSLLPWKARLRDLGGV